MGRLSMFACDYISCVIVSIMLYVYSHEFTDFEKNIGKVNHLRWASLIMLVGHGMRLFFADFDSERDFRLNVIQQSETPFFAFLIKINAYLC